jgi:hypothetical protein
MLMQTLTPQLDPLTEQQVVGICNLQQSSQQAEEALSQGLDQLHQSLAETVAGGSPLDDPNVGSFMGHMAIALGQLSNLEGFVIQADNLRQQTIHQMHRISPPLSISRRRKQSSRSPTARSLVGGGEEETHTTTQTKKGGQEKKLEKKKNQTHRIAPHRITRGGGGARGGKP